MKINLSRSEARAPVVRSEWEKTRWFAATAAHNLFVGLLPICPDGTCPSGPALQAMMIYHSLTTPRTMIQNMDVSVMDQSGNFSMISNIVHRMGTGTRINKPVSPRPCARSLPPLERMHLM